MRELEAEKDRQIDRLKAEKLKLETDLRQASVDLARRKKRNSDLTSNVEALQLDLSEKRQQLYKEQELALFREQETRNLKVETETQ